MTEPLPPDKPEPKKWTAKRIAITAAKGYAALLLVALGSSLLLWLILTLLLKFRPQTAGTNLSGSGSASTSAADGSRLPEVGSTTFMGRTNCDRAVKAILRDPGSYERISAQIVDVKPGEGWAAQVDFRSRNGWGGYDQGTAYCVFNGREYRALLDE